MFARLTTSVFENRNSRIIVRKACAVSVLFYSSDTWNLFSRNRYASAHFNLVLGDVFCASIGQTESAMPLFLLVPSYPA